MREFRLLFIVTQYGVYYARWKFLLRKYVEGMKTCKRILSTKQFANEFPIHYPLSQET